MATMNPLCQRMIEDMTLRNLSQATQQSYLYAVEKFSRHFRFIPGPNLGWSKSGRINSILSPKSFPGHT